VRMRLFIATFLPNGFPSSVAPEYARYQAWDTVQQLAFFINTVISSAAIMKFHGVGDEQSTPAAATALSMTRELIASVFALAAASPAVVSLYKQRAAVFRAISGVFDAVGHFIEVLAGMSPRAWLLYSGPVVIALGGTMGGAVRSVILQHFAEGGIAASPDYGDISLKESNQDKAGKVIGLAVGFAILSRYLSKSGDGDTEVQMLWHFAVLGLTHICGNFACTLQLRMPVVEPPATTQPMSPASPSDRFETQSRSGGHSTLRRMFLPPGYPRSMVEQYTVYQAFARLETAIATPRNLVSMLVRWQYVYGVGDSSKTAVGAVQIDIFAQSVACVSALVSGLPRADKACHYSRPVWKLRAALLGQVASMMQLGAAAFYSARPQVFFPLLALSQAIGAFASTSASRVNGAIPNALILDKDKVKLIDVKIADANQQLVVQMASGVLCIGFLMLHIERVPSLGALLVTFAALQVVTIASAIGVYLHMPAIETGMVGWVASGRQEDWEEMHEPIHPVDPPMHLQSSSRPCMHACCHATPRSTMTALPSTCCSTNQDS